GYQPVPPDTSPPPGSPDRPAAKPSEAPSAPRPPSAPAEGLWVYAVLVALTLPALVGIVLLPTGHFTRVLGVLAVVELASAFAILFFRRRRWKAGLGCVGAGLVLAVAAWFLVPTSQGLSLWSAYGEVERLTAELDELPPGDMGGFTKGAGERADLVKTFPQFRD